MPPFDPVVGVQVRHVKPVNFWASMKTSESFKVSHFFGRGSGFTLMT
jgi:hypothetical protein